MVAVLGVELHQQIPEKYALPLNPLVRWDQATAETNLGDHQSPTERVSFTFNGVQDVLSNGIGILIPPKLAESLNLYKTNYQLVRHESASSLLWVGNIEPASDKRLPIEEATVTIEVEREKISRNDFYVPSHMRIGAFSRELNRPVGVAWSLMPDRPFFQIDIPPTRQEFPIYRAGVGGPEKSVERIPTETRSYARSFSAALITDAMIPKTGDTPDFQTSFSFGGYYKLDASNLAPYGFYLLEESSDVIVGFQGGDSPFFQETRNRQAYPRPLPSWHITVPQLERVSQ